MERISKGGHFYVGTDDEGRAILADESDERCTVAPFAVATECGNGIYSLGLTHGRTPVSLDGALFLREKGHAIAILTREGRSI